MQEERVSLNAKSGGTGRGTGQTRKTTLWDYLIAAAVLFGLFLYMFLPGFFTRDILPYLHLVRPAGFTLWALGFGFLSIRQLKVSRTSVIAFLLPVYLLAGFAEASLGGQSAVFLYEYHEAAPSFLDTGAWAVYFVMLYTVVYCLSIRDGGGTKSVPPADKQAV